MTDWMALVGGYLAAGDAGELELLSRYLHDDVIVHDPSGKTTTGIVHEMEVWRTARDAMARLHHEIQEVVATDSTAAARVKVSGVLNGSFAGVSAEGKAFEIDQGLFMRLREGRIQEIWTIVDTGSFYEQVGAFPQPSKPESSPL